MNKESVYLQWYYMIFIAPAAASALLLLLSSLRLGGHRGHHGHAGGGMRHHGGVGGGGHRGHTSHSGGAARGDHRTHGSGRKSQTQDSQPLQGSWAVSFFLNLLGIGRAPMTIMAEVFGLCWGLFGLWANRLLLPPDTMPSLARLLPSLGIALGGGLICSRLSAELIMRLLPKDETSVVSRNGLFGLTGKVVYTVTPTSGRVHVYDENGTLHDETCRVAEGHSEIPKGSSARIVDVDGSGHLIVEEAPAPLKLG